MIICWQVLRLQQRLVFCCLLRNVCIMKTIHQKSRKATRKQTEFCKKISTLQIMVCHGRHWIRYIASSSNRHRNLAYQFLAINLLFLKINFVVFISKIAPQNFDPRKFPCALIRLPLFLCGTSSHLAAPCPHSSPTLIILKISTAIAIGSLQNRLKWDALAERGDRASAIGSFQNRLRWDKQMKKRRNLAIYAFFSCL